MASRAFSAPFSCRVKGIVSCAECAGCAARITPSAPPSVGATAAPPSASATAVGATSPAPRPLPPPMYAPRAASRAPSAGASSRARGNAESQARPIGEALSGIGAALSAPSGAPAQGIGERPARPAPIEVTPSAPCADCPRRARAETLALSDAQLVERALTLIGKRDGTERVAQGALLARFGRARYACTLDYCAEAWAAREPFSRPRSFNYLLGRGEWGLCVPSARGRGE